MEKPKVIDIEDKINEEQLLHREYELTEKAFSPADQFMREDTDVGVWQQEVKAWMDLNTLKGMFFNDDWVFILIDRIASKIAALPLRVVRETVQDGEAVYEPVENHPVQERVYNPNENQTYYQWMYSIVADYCLSGNGIIWDAPSINQLIHIPVEMIQIDFDLDGRVSVYRIVQYTFDNGLPLIKSIMDIPKEQVAHIRRPNPSSAIWGMSPFIPGRKSVLFSRYSMEYLCNFYLKGAQPGLIFKMADVANEKSALRLLRTVESVHTGRKNQRRNMVVPKGIEVESLAHTLADQQLKDYVDQNRETIINILQVPKHELSLAEAGSLGSEEYKTSLKNFWNGPLKSIMRSVEESLTKLLAQQLGKGHYLEFDVSEVDVLQEDMNAKADLSIKLLQTHTLNEVRAKVFNEEPLEGGDETPGQQPAAQGFPGGFGAFSSAPKEQKEGREEEIQPKVEDTAQLETPEQKPTEDDRAKVLENNVMIFNDLKARKPQWWQAREDKLTKDYDRTFAAVHKSVLNLFSDQVMTAIGLVRSELKRQGFKAMNAKQTFRKSRLKRAIRDALNNFEERWITEILKVIETRIELGYDAQLILPFNLPSQSEIAAIRGRNETRRQDMAEGRIAETFKQINQTTTEKIFRVIEEAIANSQTIEQTGRNITSVIADNMAKDFTDPEMINNRAMLIAHQEMMTASSIGQAAALEDAAEVVPNLMKMWIAAGDNRVRGNPGGLYPDAKADHWHLSGEIVPASDDFVDSKGNKLAFPRDPKGPLEAIMRCRCTFVMVPASEAESLGIRSLKPEFQNTQETT